MTEGRQPFTAEIKTLAKGPSTYDRGCIKSRRKNANDLTDENFSRFFYFRSTSDLENKPRQAACENSAEFLHRLDPLENNIRG
jgi:hypothetical protein